MHVRYSFLQGACTFMGPTSQDPPTHRCQGTCLHACIFITTGSLQAYTCIHWVELQHCSSYRRRPCVPSPVLPPLCFPPADMPHGPLPRRHPRLDRSTCPPPSRAPLPCFPFADARPSPLPRRHPGRDRSAVQREGAGAVHRLVLRAGVAAPGAARAYCPGLCTARWQRPADL